MSELEGLSPPIVEPPESTGAALPPGMARRLGWTLGILSVFGPLAVDMYLPAFPTIADHLGTTISAVQVTLAVFLLGLAVGQIVWGTLSDHVGRRVPLLAGCLLFVGTSAVCAATRSIEVLIAARFFMGLGGSAGVVVSRAIVRDLFEQREAARFYSFIMIIGGVGPIVSPLLGGLLLTWLNWRAIFWTIVAFGGFCFAAVAKNVPETLPRESRMRGRVVDVFRGYGRILATRAFLGPALAVGCAFGILFTYIANSPFVFIELFGVPAGMFGFLFATNAIGLYVGGQLNRRLLRRFTAEYLLRKGLWLNLTAAALLVVSAATGLGGFPLLFAMLFLCLSTLGVIFPNATAIAMHPFAAEAGRASAMLGVVQFLLGAAAGALVGVFHADTALPMALQIALLGLAARAFLLLTPKEA
ncbi:MAG: Bcr/CflA family multidrug efflux MFS transporter [Pirellulales bacterium]|nr:Bcr/CflA family multidrug efflux MFS transporter [Pirellulales bacterium]